MVRMVAYSLKAASSLRGDGALEPKELGWYNSECR